MFDLYVISDGEDPSTIVRTMDAALASAACAGRVCVQLRAKQLSAHDLFELGEQLRPLCHARGAKLLVNERVDVALAIMADGVHLPERALAPSVARRILGPEALIGVSCHDAAGLARATREGADFATLSPVFASPGKGIPLGVDRFVDDVGRSDLPVYALGGVQPAHAAQLRAAGAAGLAAISAISQAADPGQKVLDFLRAWSSAEQTSQRP